MFLVSLGYVKVPTPGTPVNLGTVLTALNLNADKVPNGKCHHIELWPLLANTGAVYAGLAPSSPGYSGTGAHFDKTAGTNVIKQVQVPSTTGHQDFVRIDGDGQLNSLRVADIEVDSTNANEGFAAFLAVV